MGPDRQHVPHVDHQEVARRLPIAVNKVKVDEPPGVARLTGGGALNRVEGGTVNAVLFTVDEYDVPGIVVGVVSMCAVHRATGS